MESSLRRVSSLGWLISQERQILEGRPTVILPPEIEPYFGAAGELIRDLPLGWGNGMPSKIQCAFARFDLCLKIDLEEDAGEAVVAAGKRERTDLCRIVEALASLEALGYVAEADFAYTNSSGWSDVHERNGADAKAVFWNSQAHLDCFDSEGMLVDDLPLQWSGDLELIARTLRGTGLVIEVPEVREQVFYICSDEEALD
ncbi:hypothetical protein ACFYOG_06230 [Streptomyces sp. NPDC007818]|uniref:hypothetical protein n=1 Tax=Streptomyces sp. NPDC007818 TaxID=3364780 RepID=UPI0036ADFD9D